MMLEIGSGDAYMLKEVGKLYNEILWQISLVSDSKVDEKKDIEPEYIYVIQTGLHLHRRRYHVIEWISIMCHGRFGAWETCKCIRG